MKYNVLMAFLVIFSFSNCNAQTNKDKSLKPQTKVKVNKEYDEHGNLIRLDSTYIYFYTSKINDTLSLENVRNQFDSQFQSLDSLFSKNLFLKDLFESKSTFKKDFFEDNFYKNQKEIEQLMKKMDSIRFQFYNNQFNQNELDKKASKL